MIFIFSKILVFFSFLFVFASSSLKASDLSAMSSQIKDYCQKTMTEWGVPGLAIGIVQDGKCVLKETFGVKNIKTSEKIDEHTLFCLASVSKNITGILLDRLVAAGKLKFDDKVTKYLPDFFLISDEITKEMTIEDLASHRCGLKHFSGDSFLALGWSREEIMQGLKKLKQERIFRKNYTYQNQVFGILTLIIEKATGKTFKEVVKDYLFEHAMMFDSSSGLPTSSWFSFLNKQNFATPHSFRHKKITPTKLCKEDYTFEASTGINTSLHDMLLYLDIVLNKINKKEKSSIFEPHTIPKNFKKDDPNFPSDVVQNVSYCMGSFKFDYRSKFVAYNQMGGMPGWRNIICFVPELNVGFVVMTNAGSLIVSWAPEAIQFFILDLLCNLKPDDWSSKFLERTNESRKKNDEFDLSISVSNASPHMPLEKYAHTFHNDIYGNITFEVQDKNLFMLYRGKKLKLTHKTGSMFSFNAEEISEHFSNYNTSSVVFNADASSCEIDIMYEGKDTTFKIIN